MVIFEKAKVLINLDNDDPLPLQHLKKSQYLDRRSTFIVDLKTNRVENIRHYIRLRNFNIVTNNSDLQLATSNLKNLNKIFSEINLDNLIILLLKI